MPRREQAHPFVIRLGQRFRELRKEKGYSLEQVTFGSGLSGKGFMSDFENGRSLPSACSLNQLAEFLGVGLLDLFNFPERGPRNQLVEVTRNLGDSELKVLLKEATAFRAENRAKPAATRKG